MKQKFTILFDLDGTLVDTAPDLMRAHNHVMKKFGYPTKSTEEIRNLVGKGAGAMIGRSVYHSPYLLADIEKEIFKNSNIKEREEIVEELIDYVKAQVQMGTRVNQVMRHTLGLFHGQTGSSHWKRYLSENMCVRDADVKKIDHIMDKVRLSPKLHSAGRID